MSYEYSTTFWWDASFRPYVGGYLDESGLGGPMTGVEGGYSYKLTEKQYAGYSEWKGLEFLLFGEVNPGETEHWATGAHVRAKKYRTYGSIAAGTGFSVRNIDPDKTDPSYGFPLDVQFGTLGDSLIISAGVSIYLGADSRNYVAEIKGGFDLFKLMGIFDALLHVGN
ncbi:MAG: hypothetical protein HYT75_05325 [Deltaproteobacteria bacterium]|nr:hypothetical protein [Deltaproteobacteria bacterium]